MGSQLPAGLILWVKHCTVQTELDCYGITEAATDHPCLVIKPTINVQELITICIITSRRGKNINEEPHHPARFRQRYLPIYPQSQNEALPDVMLHLEHGMQMRWLSYVNTAKVYRLPGRMLKQYEDFKNPSAGQYRLEVASMHVVIDKLGMTALALTSGLSGTTKPAAYAVTNIPPSRHATPLIAASRQPAVSYGSVPASSYQSVESGHGVLPQHTADIFIPTRAHRWGRNRSQQSNSFTKALITSIGIAASILILLAILLLPDYNK